MGFKNWLRNLFLPIRRWFFYRVQKMHSCMMCGEGMKNDWSFCPHCGFDEARFDRDYEMYCKQGKSCEKCGRVMRRMDLIFFDETNKNRWLCPACGIEEKAKKMNPGPGDKDAW